MALWATRDSLAEGCPRRFEEVSIGTTSKTSRQLLRDWARLDIGLMAARPATVLLLFSRYAEWCDNSQLA
jgi:hypothetical protein